MKKIFFRRPLFFASFILIFIGLQGVYFKNEIKEAYLNGEDVYATVMDNDGGNYLQKNEKNNNSLCYGCWLICLWCKTK